MKTSGESESSHPAGCSSLGRLLRGHRLDAALSQRDLATRIAVHPDLVTLFERDEQTPTADQLAALIDALDLDPPQATELRRHHARSRLTELPAQHPSLAAPEIWNVPVRNPSFTGRLEMLSRLRHQLGGDSATVILPVALHGLGGVGKTQLALEFAHRFKAAYDLVWWVDAEQLELIDVSLAALAERMDLSRTGSVPEDARAAREALRRGQPHERWLLVFDNADEPDDLVPYLPDPGAGGHLLITSRNQDWSRIVSPLQVDVFARAESVERLTSCVEGLGVKDADTIAELVGDLPLAVDSAAAWLASTGTPVDQYLGSLASQTTRVLSLDQPRGYALPVAAVWSLSISRLREHEPAAAQLLELTAFMSPDGIATDLLFSDEAINALRRCDQSVTDSLAVGNLVREIVRLSLMHPNAGQLRVHRLVQDAVQAQMTARIADDRRHEVHQILASFRPTVGNVDDWDNWPRYAQIWPHLTPSKAALCDEEPVRELMIDRVRYLWKIGEFRRALEFARSVEAGWSEVAESAYAENPHAVLPLQRQLLKLRHEIANVLRSEGRFKQAHDLDTAVLEQQSRVLPEHYPDALVTAGSLAADLRGLGDYRRALETDRPTYNQLRKMLGDDDPWALAAANNLAVSFRLTGDFRTARQLDEATLAKRRTVLGPHHPYTLTSQANVGLDLLAAGHYAEAVVLLRSVLAVLREALGEADLGTLRTATSLATALGKAGRRDEALALAQDTYSLHLAKYDALSPETLSCAMSLATALAATGSRSEAVEMATQTLSRLTQNLGAGHPHTLMCMNNLALYMRKTGPADEALKLAERATRELAICLGENHPCASVAAANLANCLADTGSLVIAEQRQHTALEALTASCGTQHPDTLIVESNLAVTLNALGRKRESRRLRQHALSGLAEVLGEDFDFNQAKALRGWSRNDLDLQPQPI